MSRYETLIQRHKAYIEECKKQFTLAILEDEPIENIISEIRQHEHIIKELRHFQPYVELGEMVANSKLIDTKGPKGVLRLTLEFEHKQGITLVKLLQQIREQENG